uniref:hypothetical protein n=1 Tax=Agathobacter sp. TaxID=2021311 RepID=UPI004055E6AD
MITLSTASGYIYIQGGTREDGRTTVQASGSDHDQFRLFQIKCRDRQAQERLLELADGCFSPDFSQWKDITKKVQNEMEQLAKNNKERKEK